MPKSPLQPLTFLPTPGFADDNDREQYEQPLRSGHNLTAAPPSTPSTPARLLTTEEISTLLPIFRAEGQELPDPTTSFFVGHVSAAGSVESFLVVQLRVHAEPMWIAPGHEAQFRSLVHMAESEIRERLKFPVDVFLFAPEGKVAGLAQVAGLKGEPWHVYSKRIEPEPDNLAAATAVDWPIEAGKVVK